MRRKLAAGNWKMNGLVANLEEVAALAETHSTPISEVLICPPTTLVGAMAASKGSYPLAVGGQDCHAADSGAHTGDVSAEMLADAGAGYVILGHSERRADHGETNLTVHAKTEAAWRAGLSAIVCLGETLEEREAERTLDVVGGQLAGSVPDGASSGNLVIAYEPVWAIGTGKVPTLGQIAEVHGFIRAQLVERFGPEGEQMRVLYGGSVKPGNAVEIFGVADVDGALVGGASLKAADFAVIIVALDGAHG